MKKFINNFVELFLMILMLFVWFIGGIIFLICGIGGIYGYFFLESNLSEEELQNMGFAVGLAGLFVICLFFLGIYILYKLFKNIKEDIINYKKKIKKE